MAHSDHILGTPKSVTLKVGGVGVTYKSWVELSSPKAHSIA
jgi:hypothetical protein